MHMVGLLSVSKKYGLPISFILENNRYDRAIKQAMAVNGREVDGPDGGNGTNNGTDGPNPTFPGSTSPSGPSCFVQQKLGLEQLWSGGTVRTSADIIALFSQPGLKIMAREVSSSHGI